MSGATARRSAPPSAAGEDGLIGEADFKIIVAMLRATAGIVLSDSKRELVSSRLARRVRALGLSGYTQYRQLVESPAGEAERREMTNALTTNLTSFFREEHHFDHFADPVLSGLLQDGGKRRLRIWSAACSSGEEPYSIAMVLHKAIGSKTGWDARILATDIDSNMVATAAAGRYDNDRMAGIPARYVSRRMADGVMPDELKRYITFNQLNLLDGWPMRGPFDVIFCRNVVIYFDKDTQRVLFDRIADIMTPGGTLFIGHSETLFRVSDRFESLGRTMYRKLR